jgi:hypothetical protein
MNYKLYNLVCLFTSLLVLLILLNKFKQIDYCIILLIAAVFSCLWRGTKLYKGEKYIESDNHKCSHILFNLDFLFAVFAFICIISTGKINKKFILFILFIFICSWSLEIINLPNTGQIIHTYGHFTIIIIIVLTYYLNFF